MTKVHLDTDIGGDTDDLFALAMLLKWPGVELTGVTTVADEGGRRAGCARYVLDLMRCSDIPVTAGAEMSGGYFRYDSLWFPPDEDNWPEPVPRRPGALDDALELLKASVDQGAMVIGIGPYTNLRLLDEKYPGILRRAELFLMGGFVFDLPPGYPNWQREDDWNLEVDIRSAQYVIEHASPTFIPITVTSQTAIRRANLPRLAQAGDLGQLIVRQAEVYAKIQNLEEKYGVTGTKLPPDIINFQHDPLACAIALGWRDGVEIETVPIRLDVRDGWIYETPDPGGIPTRIVTRIDGDAFNELWCNIICS